MELRDHLKPEDIVIEEGENLCGGYIKCANGKLYMRTIFESYPVIPIWGSRVIELERKGAKRFVQAYWKYTS
jgi:hypothetical protein